MSNKSSDRRRAHWAGRPSQINLVSAVVAELDRQGFVDLNTRHWNAIIAACDMVVADVGKPHEPAVPGSGLTAWLLSDDTGLSSMLLAATLKPLGTSRIQEGPTAFPRDPDDFGRCVRLLEAVPEFRGELHRAATLSPAWARLIAAWDELEALYREELPTGEAPRLYERIQAMNGEGTDR